MADSEMPKSRDVVIWDLDPGKPSTSFIIRQGSVEHGRVDSMGAALKQAKRLAVGDASDVWLRRGFDVVRVWTFTPGAIVE